MPIVKDWKGQVKFVPPQPVLPDGIDFSLDDEDSATVIVSSDGTTVTQLPDGSAVIGNGLAGGQEADKDFSANLAETLGEPLTAIAQDLLEGIEADIRSRSDMISTYVKGIDLLGLKIEDRTGKRQRKNISTIRHPVLLESVVRFQSGARAELLPAAGPCKVKNDGDKTAQTDDLARALENDINHYLTTTATEYYPDTDRGLFYLGYGGTVFKKVYRCPIRKRPVSECVYATDLIVSEQATDLDNALRVTHKMEYTRADVKRMQHAGAWRDVELMTPSPSNDQVKQKINSTQGLSKTGVRPQDMEYTIYECYCDIIPDDYGFSEPDAVNNFPLPYRVTIDKDSRVVLDMRRLWKKGDEDYKRQLPFVKYGLVPGLGFLDYGYVHLLGNQTRALTAIWRILVDAGTFNNFPGGVKVKGTRQSTNEINPGPGEWSEIDTGPMEDIRAALMPLPYKEPSAVFIQLSELIGQDAQRMAGAVEMQVGEGRTNVPVGTIMAMIEQQTQVMAAVHKRLHTSQKQEFIKLKELFAEDPEALYRSNPDARKWNAEELKSVTLVPSSDPNVPAQTHRIMQATALITLAAQNPDIYDKLRVHERALKTIGVTDTQDILHAPPPPMPQQDPRLAALTASLKGKAADTHVKMAELAQKSQQQQREAADRVVQSQEKDKELAAEMQRDELDRQTQERIAQMKEETERLRIAKEINDSSRQFSQEEF